MARAWLCAGRLGGRAKSPTYWLRGNRKSSDPLDSIPWIGKLRTHLHSNVFSPTRTHFNSTTPSELRWLQYIQTSTSIKWTCLLPFLFLLFCLFTFFFFYTRLAILFFRISVALSPVGFLFGCFKMYPLFWYCYMWIASLSYFCYPHLVHWLYEMI